MLATMHSAIPPTGQNNRNIILRIKGLRGGSVVKKKKKNPPTNAGDTGVNGNLFQYSCLGKPMNRGVW